MARLTAVLLVLIGLTVWAYRPVLTAGFVYEDRNPWAEKQTPNVAKDERVPWKGVAEEWADVHLGPRMLTRLTTRLQVWAGAEARGFHLFNLGLHLVNGLLVALLVLPYGAMAAGISAALWWLHPIQVESVAYVAARTDLLVVLSVLLLLHASRVAGWRGLFGMIAAGLLGFSAKESAVAIVGLVPLWCWYERRPVSRWVLPVGVWLTAGMVAAVRLLRVTATMPDKWHALALYTPPAPHGGFWYAAVQSAAVWRLLALVAWPSGFTVDHDFDAVSQGLALTALVGSVAVLGLAWRHRSSWPLAAFAIGWVVLALAPRFLVPLPDYVNEHQIVVALIGPCLAAGVAGSRLVAMVQAWSDTLEALSVCGRYDRA